ncbi:hypothetical protein D3C76_1766990 [compost metagenome]
MAGDEIQGFLPEGAAWRIQQYYRHQRTFAGLDQGQYFQGFIQGTEPAWAQDQGVGLLDEEQLANEEEMKRQQLVGAVHRGVGMLLEG